MSDSTPPSSSRTNKLAGSPSGQGSSPSCSSSSNGERARGNLRALHGSNLQSLVGERNRRRTPVITSSLSSAPTLGRAFNRAGYSGSPASIGTRSIAASSRETGLVLEASRFSEPREELQEPSYWQSNDPWSHGRTARLGMAMSLSAPSPTGSPFALIVYGFGPGQAQGAAPFGNAPSLDISMATPDPGGSLSRDPEILQGSPTEGARRLMKECNITGVEGLGERLQNGGSEPQGNDPSSRMTTPTAQEHEGNAQPPSQARGGILGTVVLPCSPSNGVGDYGHANGGANSGSAASASPIVTGQTTPEWYNRSTSTSSTSLETLLRDFPNSNDPVYGGGAAGLLRYLYLSKPSPDEEITITIHIAEALVRQKYILKLCKALMILGAPTHRLEDYMNLTSQVLELDGQFMYIPNYLGKLEEAHVLNKDVVHNISGVEEAIERLDEVMKRKPKHSPWALVPVYGIATVSVGPFGFMARPIDMPILFLMGCIFGIMQLILAPRSRHYSNLFEISAAMLTSFLARAFGSIRGGNLFCFSALAQSSLALILPGYVVLCGSLELQSRNLVSGAVRMFYAIFFSLLLGFGITIGAALYGLIDKNAISATTCQDPLSWEWNFLFVPAFAFCLLVISQAKWRQAPVMIAIAMAGYTVNFFTSHRLAHQPQVANSIAAFAVGILGNLYSRLSNGLAFASMLPAIFVLVPSGLSAQGSLLAGIKAANSVVNNPHTTALTGLLNNSIIVDVGFSMVQVAIGITVGLSLSALVVYPFGKKRSGLLSF